MSKIPNYWQEFITNGYIKKIYNNIFRIIKRYNIENKILFFDLLLLILGVIIDKFSNVIPEECFIAYFIILVVIFLIVLLSSVFGFIIKRLWRKIIRNRVLLQTNHLKK